MKTDPTPDPAPSADMGKKKKQKKPSKPKFKGETDGMNGFVFETSEEVKDPTGFVRTLEALERFSNKNYKPIYQQYFINQKELYLSSQGLISQMIPLMHMIKKLSPLKLNLILQKRSNL